MSANVIEKHVTDACTSHADDLAYRALGDLTAVSGDFDEYRVVGGHMVNLLRLAYQTEGAIARRTSDADAAIGLQIAAGGHMHDRLVALGYTAETGNRYVLDGRTIDLLVPSGTGAFTSELRGERTFDAAPGLQLDPGSPHLTVTVSVVFTNGDEANYTVRVPTVERAVIMKSYALISRRETKDLVDLYNLLLIARAYSAETIGGWKLGEQNLTATRLDTARNLRAKLRSPATRRQLEGSAVQPSYLLALAQTMIPAMVSL